MKRKNPTTEGAAYIDPVTGKLCMELEVRNRLVEPSLRLPGLCTICGGSLDNLAPRFIAWNPETGLLEPTDGDFGDPVCRECEVFCEHLRLYRNRPIARFRFEERSLVERRGSREVFQVVHRRHDGVLRARSFWPVYVCRKVELRPGLLPRIETGSEVELAEHELEPLPSGAVADTTLRLGGSAAPEPPRIESLRELEALPDASSEPELAFPARRVIC